MKILSLSTALMAAASAETALTIYNQNLAVVRETLPLDLKPGENPVSFDRATAQVMPDSVVLRDPAGKAAFSILEQSYRNDPVSRSLLLSHFEGQEIEFRSVYPDGKVELQAGKIVRSGHVPGGQPQDPIIEVDGKLRFQLPGEPLFPALGDGSILRPTLGWQIRSDAAAKFDAQLSYLSNGFNWEADYNLVAPEKGETVTLTGWVTVNNQSGTAFQDAKVKLVAGEVNIIEPSHPNVGMMRSKMMAMEADAAPAVQEKAFDDFHLYTLQRPLTIRDKETKQVEFLRAAAVKASKRYVYDPAAMRFFGGGGPQTQPIQGMEFPKDVAIYWEFKNDESNGLGVPLPAGRVRFYRSDDQDGNLEFVGENDIDHTPRNEEVSIYTGNAFDLVGERKIVNFERDDRAEWMKESIEITVKNRSKEPKEIVVREHLWRWLNWKIENASMESVKKDAQKIEFTVKLAPDEEKKVTYTAHYSW
ncbi:MAG: DUF4139 domain-containing protein [Verrucomicrobia bacterium]|nr:MAG: DUF4139 domain-containing protein [Verrucomicrobiota bacterium]TAE88176.1 MAG: DUF4139 domain-containing protein [Verrucomicrobiota bacterium]TAF26060.1 MAG: DUF4139 domain-containing protein [Verrucomicrobiota bacterium]TAF41015.1 MAG: DUF4139 domain-containing protein [Verrucomicrobiota bacterium]